MAMRADFDYVSILQQITGKEQAKPTRQQEAPVDLQIEWRRKVTERINEDKKEIAQLKEEVAQLKYLVNRLTQKDLIYY